VNARNRAASAGVQRRCSGGFSGGLAGEWSGADPFADGQFGTSTATRQDVLEEMCYQLGTRKSLPSARLRTEPLPPVSALARAIGVA